MSTVQAKERLEERKRAIDLAIEVLDEVDSVPAVFNTHVNGNGLTVAAAAKEVLAAGQPLKTKPLAAAIQQKGFQTRSKNFYPVVYKALRSHSDLFANTKQGWTLKQAS